MDRENSASDTPNLSNTSFSFVGGSGKNTSQMEDSCQAIHRYKKSASVGKSSVQQHRQNERSYSLGSSPAELLTEYELYHTQHKRIEQLMQELLLQVPNAAKLLGIKGVGLVTATTLNHAGLVDSHTVIHNYTLM